MHLCMHVVPAELELEARRRRSSGPVQMWHAPPSWTYHLGFSALACVRWLRLCAGSMPLSARRLHPDFRVRLCVLAVGMQFAMSALHDVCEPIHACLSACSLGSAPSPKPSLGTEHASTTKMAPKRPNILLCGFFVLRCGMYEQFA